MIFYHAGLIFPIISTFEFALILSIICKLIIHDHIRHVVHRYIPMHILNAWVSKIASDPSQKSIIKFAVI